MTHWVNRASFVSTAAAVAGTAAPAPVAVRLRGWRTAETGTHTKAGLNAALCGVSRRAGRPTA